MIWINLFTVVLVSGYAQWLVYRSWRFFRDLARTNNAGEVLKIVLEQRSFYFTQGIGGLIALTLFLGVKALLLLFKFPEATTFTTFVFGDFTSRFMMVKLGCLGAGTLATSAACFYQCIKSKHYFDVLYALRNQLQLGPEFRVFREPTPGPVAQRHLV